MLLLLFLAYQNSFEVAILIQHNGLSATIRNSKNHYNNTQYSIVRQAIFT